MKEIQLTKGKKALVDDQDFELLSRFKWHFCAASKGYAINSQRIGKKVEKIYMHRFILNPKKGLEIDHINGNGLDNRRQNLRICTRTINGNNLHNRRVKTGKLQPRQSIPT